MTHNIPFNLDALLIFAKVVECRSLTKAAALLNMPKSTVSRKLSRLESELGLKLLRKNTHQISVTDLGEQVYNHCQNILAQANGIRTLVEGSKQEPQGGLRVAIPVFLGVDYASRVGATFLQRYPKSQLEIQLVDHLAHPIKDGYDLVFGTGPLRDSTLIGRKLFTLEFFLCASAEFLAQREEPISTPNQLNSTPFIAPDFFGSASKFTLIRGRRQQEIAPPIRARANNLHVCKQFLMQSVGVGIMPKQIMCVDEVQAGSIVPVLPEWRPAPVEVHMLYPFQLSFSNLVSAFYETALEIIQENSAIASFE